MINWRTGKVFSENCLAHNNDDVWLHATENVQLRSESRKQMIKPVHLHWYIPGNIVTLVPAMVSSLQYGFPLPNGMSTVAPAIFVASLSVCPIDRSRTVLVVSLKFTITIFFDLLILYLR